MNKCRKCGKDINKGFMFCPFCGAKLQKVPEKADFSNFEFLTVAENGSDLFSKVFDELLRNGSDAVLAYLGESADAVPCFFVKCRYSRGGRKCKGALASEDTFDYIKRIEALWDKTIHFESFYVESGYLKKRHLKDLRSRSYVFLSEQEAAQKALSLANKFGVCVEGE